MACLSRKWYEGTWVIVCCYLQPALYEGVLYMTEPDSPSSPTQEYRLTDVGRKLMERGMSK